MARPASLRAVNVTRDRVLAVSVEDAEGLWGKFLGLMGRPSLPDGAGLWLPESNGIHMMFMRFPIDALFLSRPDPARDGARTVLRASERLPAWRGLVPLVRGAHGVLELPAGAIAESGTQVGDAIQLEPLG
ncbi:MAG TPA: DUF192 domain-containing protein [Candidatus Limnocylindrales bacterium]|nr:DUF192 domain-containing protein [Candidatus Limnocylindrales bacterium]